MYIVSHNCRCTGRRDTLSYRGQSPILSCESVSEFVRPESPKLADGWIRTAELDMPSKMQENAELACERTFFSSSALGTAKISIGSRNFRADNQIDFLGAATMHRTAWAHLF
jgi:hypothetical protein